jgi:hypothetical protein
MASECKTRTRLELEWREAADMYSTLAASLAEKSGNCTEEEYRMLHDVMDKAHNLSEQLRRDLDEHTRSHGC